ncbi:MAG: heme-binding protein [Deltaproteobacteria bacterium]|jgi:DNA gyrase inhibitor GyrI|nr:heme-binding protein [Deltaproteobacteria bacterium]
MKNRNFLRCGSFSVATILGAIWVSFIATGCTFFGIRTTEEAGYVVMDKHDHIEIRAYEELVIAETSVNTGYDKAGNIAFKRLFAYISGENLSKEKIPMTAPVMAREGDAPAGDKIPMSSPVLGERHAGGWRFSFVLPAGTTLENAPLPSNPDITLAVIPRKKVAVIRYSGSWKERTMREKSEELVEWIRVNGLEVLSGPRSARYDPPWTLPFFRRNEIMVDID